MICYPGLLGHYNDTIDAESLDFEDEGITIYESVINCVVMYFTLTACWGILILTVCADVFYSNSMLGYFNLNGVW